MEKHSNDHSTKFQTKLARLGTQKVSQQVWLSIIEDDLCSINYYEKQDWGARR